MFNSMMKNKKKLENLGSIYEKTSEISARE